MSLKQEQANQWIFHFMMDDSVYSEGNSQLSIELPQKTWVKQPYNGREIVIAVEDLSINQTLSFPFKMIYKIVGDNCESTASESSQSVDTSEYFEFSESMETESVTSSFDDFVICSSPIENQREKNFIGECQEKETENMKSVISYLESEITVLKARSYQQDQLLSENDALKIENEELQIMIFGLKSELESNKIKNEMREKALAEIFEKEKLDLEENIKNTESELETLRLLHVSDVKEIAHLTRHERNFQNVHRACENEHENLLGLVQTLQMENQNLNSTIFELESDLRHFQQENQQRDRQSQYFNSEQRMENLEHFLTDESTEMGELGAMLLAENMLVKTLQRELGQVNNVDRMFVHNGYSYNLASN